MTVWFERLLIVTIENDDFVTVQSQRQAATVIEPAMLPCIARTEWVG